MSGKSSIFLLTAVLFFCAGVISNVSAISEGYILSGSFMGDTTELFDKNGTVVFRWIHTDIDTTKKPKVVRTATNGYSCYLLENGNLLRSCNPPGLKVGPGAAPVNGVIQEVGRDGKVLWADTIADLNQSLHHDFKPLFLPNGDMNILAVSFVTVDSGDASAAGVDKTVYGTLKSFQVEKIIEIKPDRTGAGNSQIVWEWHLLDHVASQANIAAHPELFDGTHPAWPAFPQQWVHLNGIDFNANKNLIVFSSRVFSEVYVIDHSTTTAQAAGSTGGTYGKGGDILYRWGHPSNYIVQFDTVLVPADTQIVTFPKKDTIITAAHTEIKRKSQPGDFVNCLHCPTWIPEGYRNAGNIMFFHNNSDPNMKQLGCSQAVEINPWDANGNLQKISIGAATAPLTPSWAYNSTDSMYSASMSSAIRMKKGNTLIHEAYPGGNSSGKSSVVREVDPSGLMVGTKMTLKKATGYNPAKIMYYPEDYPGVLNVLGVGAERKGTSRREGSGKSAISIRAGRIAFSNVKGAGISIYSLQGKRIMTLRPSTDAAGVSTAAFPAGTYLVKVCIAGKEPAGRMITVAR